MMVFIPRFMLSRLDSTSALLLCPQGSGLPQRAPHAGGRGLHPLKYG
jgi:hypothetical protein